METQQNRKGEERGTAGTKMTKKERNKREGNREGIGKENGGDIDKEKAKGKGTNRVSKRKPNINEEGH